MLRSSNSPGVPLSDWRGRRGRQVAQYCVFPLLTNQSGHAVTDLLLAWETLCILYWPISQSQSVRGGTS